MRNTLSIGEKMLQKRVADPAQGEISSTDVWGSALKPFVGRRIC